jgi:transposase
LYSFLCENQFFSFCPRGDMVGNMSSEMERVRELEALRAEKDRLQEANQRLTAENATLRKRVTKLEARIAELELKLAAVERAGHRQATPFAKGEPKANPKKPGRKAGHPPAHRSRPPKVNKVEEAPLPATCPSCGGQVQEERVEVQYQVDIPPVEPVVTQFNVHIGHCAGCGQRLQGRHAQQTSEALGAAAVQIGPRALALAAEAKHELGVPYGKVSRLFETAFGLTVSRGAWARADQRLAASQQAVYEHLILVLRQSGYVCGDETGWKKGAQSAWLWVFANEAVSVYVIDPRRAHEVAERILGRDFGGVLQCDCFLAYDALACRQQKCLQHLLRQCDALVASQSAQTAAFSRQVAQLLRGAIHLRHRYEQGKISAHGYQVARGRLEATLDRWLKKSFRNPDNMRLAKLLQKHRAQLFVFLDDPQVPPTNAEGEQEIRPAVVTRKIGGCNRTDAGAEAHQVLSSVLRTCRKHDQSFIDLVSERLRNPAAALPEWLRRLLPPPKPTAQPPATAPP